MVQESGISEGRADYKVPEGKLIRVHVWHRNGVVDKVRFYGDFFMHPEEAMEELENSLKGLDVSEAGHIISSFFESVEIVGAKAEDFTHALSLAIKKEIS